MARQRLTWDESREASAHPATPDEGPASPAYKPEPSADQYQNGDTSSWGEDVHPGPYPNGAHPATPDEGPASPAYKAAAALEKKAQRCIRVAEELLGDAQGDPKKVARIEQHAMQLMDLEDAEISSYFTRLGMEDDEDEDEGDEESSKKASLSKAAAEKIAGLESRIARLERVLIRLAEEDDSDDEDDSDEDDSEEGKKKAGFSAEEEMLEAMLKEEGMWDEGSDDEAMCGEPMMEEPMMEEPMEMMDEEPMMDPMGVMDVEMDDDEMMVLAQLHPEMADRVKAAAEEEEVEEEEVEEEAKKKASTPKAASVKPRPKAASATGATRLGGPVSKEAAAEINELASIWETAPDVSSHF